MKVEVLELHLLGLPIQARDMKVVGVVEELVDKEGLADTAAAVHNDEFRLFRAAVFFQLANFVFATDKQVLVHDRKFFRMQK